MSQSFVHSLSAYAKKDFYGFIGFLFFLYFFLLSIIFYKECIVHQDLAWEITWILNGNGNTPVFFRWGSNLWRIFLIAGPQLHLSLKAIIMLSSVWFVFLKFITWLICHFYFRNPIAGILVVVSILFSQSKGFYAQNLQVFNGADFFCLLFAVITDDVKPRITNEWVKILIISILLYLIKGTHIAILMACPVILLQYLANGFNYRKLIPICFILVVSVVYQIYFAHPHESGHAESIWLAAKNTSLYELSGVLVYFGKQLVSLNFLIPIVLLMTTLYQLMKERKLMLTAAITIYSVIFLLMSAYKLASINTVYPMSDGVEYYVQGAFYSVFLMFAASFFYWLKKQSPSVLSNPHAKLFIVFAIFLFGSKITYAGIELYEYNRYTLTLLDRLDQDFVERIFIIDESSFPHKFTKVNVNVEFETLINSSMESTSTTALWVTSYPTPYKYEEGNPIFISGIAVVEKTLNLEEEMNTSRYPWKTFNPKTHFNGCNKKLFPLGNFNHRVVTKEYMDSFNKDYGFTVTEY